MNRRHFLQTGLSLAAARVSALAQDAAHPAKSLNLKIAGLKTFVVNAGSVNWVYCKVHTNQGLTGLGEGSVTSKEATLAQAIQEHERFLIGKDPTDIELLWQGMFRYPRWRGGPILNSAISAVEIALWDILGKALGVPIYKLLGGAARKRVRLYLDVGGATAEQLTESFVKAKSEGYTAAKSGFITVNNDLVLPAFAVREAARKLEMVRKAVGDDFDICIDAHGQLTTPMAVDFCTRIEDLRPFFVEEATQLEDLGELELLRGKTKVPLATGERSFTKYGFAEFCSRHLVNYVQPDVCHAGGILEMKKIGTIAEDLSDRDGAAQPAERGQHAGFAARGRNHARFHDSGVQPGARGLGSGAFQWRSGPRQRWIRRPARPPRFRRGSQREGSRRASLQTREPPQIRLL